jgi:hypothetical protein
MTDERESSVKVIEPHQELVSHLEKSTGRMRALSLVTVIVAAFFALAYAFQLAFALTGTRTVTVDLMDPVNEATELVATGLALVWLYVGARDYLFSTRLRKVVKRARSDEKELARRLPAEPTASEQG